MGRTRHRARTDPAPKDASGRIESDRRAANPRPGLRTTPAKGRRDRKPWIPDIREEAPPEPRSVRQPGGLSTCERGAAPRPPVATAGASDGDPGVREARRPSAPGGPRASPHPHLQDFASRGPTSQVPLPYPGGQRPFRRVDRGTRPCAPRAPRAPCAGRARRARPDSARGRGSPTANGPSGSRPSGEGAQPQGRPSGAEALCPAEALWSPLEPSGALWSPVEPRGPATQRPGGAPSTGGHLADGSGSRNPRGASRARAGPRREMPRADPRTNGCAPEHAPPGGRSPPAWRDVQEREPRGPSGRAGGGPRSERRVGPRGPDTAPT